MSPSTPGRLSARRLLAEALALLGYRRFQNRYWELRAEDVIARYSFTEDLPLLEELTREIGARTVVEVGCGAGRAFEAYARAGAKRIVGIELAAAMAARARARAAELAPTVDVSVLERDIREPLPPGLSGDLLASSRVLQHIHPRDIGRTLANLARLAPRAIYLNESLAPGRAAHLFGHDYEALLAPLGFTPARRGLVPKIGYEYLVFKPAA